jgi:hypothetical protein
MRKPVVVAAVMLCVSMAGCGGSDPPARPVEHMPQASAFGSTIEETLVFDTVLHGNRILEKDLTFPADKAGDRVIRLECLGKGMTWVDVRFRGGGGSSSISFSCDKNRGVQRALLAEDDVYADKDGRTKVTVHAYGKETMKPGEGEYEDDAERYDIAPADTSYSIMLSYPS